MGHASCTSTATSLKQTAIRLSRQPGMQVETVAAALEIHPLMLSKWRKDVRMSSSAAERQGATVWARARDRAAAGAGAAVCRVSGGARTPKRGHSVLFRSNGETFVFIDAHYTQFSVTQLARTAWRPCECSFRKGTLCKALKVIACRSAADPTTLIGMGKRADRVRDIAEQGLVFRGGNTGVRW
ncbi:MAG: transposase [bacterium]